MILNYSIFGEKDRSPVMILHGLFGCLDNWQNIANELSKNFYVITVDLPNHGRSFHTEEFSYNSMVQSIRELFDYLVLPKTILIGHSMGGKVAMMFTSEFPFLINKLLVVDIAPKKYPPHHDEILDTMNTLDFSKIKSRKEAEDIVFSKLNNRLITLFLLKNIKRTADNKSFEWKLNLPILSKNIEKVIDETVIDFPISIDTLFMKGELSNYILDDDEELISHYFTNYNITTISNSGHWLHYENPKEFVSKFIDWALPFAYIN